MLLSLANSEALRSLANRLRHQKTALSFMIQREDGPIPEEYTLWKTREEDGVHWYGFGQRLYIIPLTPPTAIVMF